MSLTVGIVYSSGLSIACWGPHCESNAGQGGYGADAYWTCYGGFNTAGCASGVLEASAAQPDSALIISQVALPRWVGSAVFNIVMECTERLPRLTAISYSS